MKIDLIFLIILGIVVGYIFVLYRIDKVETMADVSVTDQMKAAISQIYNADVEAIRNLSNVATKLQAGGLTVPGNLKVGANLATNGLDPANMPDGWGGGLRIFDGYSSGTIGFGPDGKKLNAYMNRNGDMRSINMNTDNAVINGNANVTGDIVFNGANKWIIHTPDDNRRIMYMAPGNDKGEWMWDKQTMFNNDGSVQLSGAIKANSLCIGGTCIGEQELKYLTKGFYIQVANLPRSDDHPTRHNVNASVHMHGDGVMRVAPMYSAFNFQPVKGV